MPALPSDPRSAPPEPAAPPRARRRILLTGGSGVIGRALLERLVAAGHDVTCLVHRTPVAGPGVRSVAGDVTEPDLGLEPAVYRWVAGHVDVVVHSAAVTDFHRRDGSLEHTNVGGTAQVVALARRAGVPLVHLSSAYLHARPEGERGATSARYAASKRAGEDVVRDGGVPHTIVRPSIVIGDSVTGEVAAFQGLYLVVAAILDGLVPVIPFDATWPVDCLPADVVADAIATVVERDVVGRELWVTAGPEALRLGRAVELTLEEAARIGVDLDPPRFVPPDVYDRLFAPVFLDALPRRTRLTVVRLMELFAAYLAVDGPLPDSHAELAALGARGVGDLEAAFRTSFRHWAERTGRCVEAVA